MLEHGVRLLSVWHIEQWLIQQLARGGGLQGWRVVVDGGGWEG